MTDYNWLPIAVLAIIFSSCVRDSHQLECFEIDDPTWVIFADLQNYRMYKQTFDVRVDINSNWVRIQHLPSPHLQQSQFQGSSSQYIVRMDLSTLGISTVLNGSFRNLTCMRTLELQDNKLTTLPAHALEDMVYLRTLNLTKNRIGHITTDMLGHLRYLHTLDLTLNLIHGVDAKAFARLPNLQFMNFSSNILVDLNFQEWGFQANLMNLNMSSNSIQTVTSSRNASFTSFTRLDLSFNRLDALDVPALKFMAPNLVLLFVHGNQFSCSYLERMVEDFARFHFFYRAKNETFTNVEGIDCIGSFKEDLIMDKTKKNEKPAEYLYPKKATTSVDVTEFMKTLSSNNSILLDAIHSMKTVTVMMFVLILMCMCVNVMISSGLMERINRWARLARRSATHEPIENSTEIENFRLIQANV